MAPINSKKQTDNNWQDLQSKIKKVTGSSLLVIIFLTFFTGSLIMVTGILMGLSSAIAAWVIYSRIAVSLPVLNKIVIKTAKFLEILIIFIIAPVSVIGGLQGIIAGITFHLLFSYWLSTIVPEPTKNV